VCEREREREIEIERERERERKREKENDHFYSKHAVSIQEWLSRKCECSEHVLQPPRTVALDVMHPHDLVDLVV